MELKEKRYIEFVQHLWENHVECFTSYPWTENLDGEEWFFAVFIRTLIWNDMESEKLYKKILGFKGTLHKYNSMASEEFEEWFSKMQEDIQVGGRNQGGAHRKQYHKSDNPKALHIYLKKVGKSQMTFYKDKSFDQLYQELKSIPSFGKLIPYDILSRLIQTRHNYLNVYPLKAYETGSGPRKGLKAIYGEELSDKELMECYQELGKKIEAVSNIPSKLFWFILEDILCVYQKRKIKVKSLKMLSGELNPAKYSKLYAETFCKNARA